MFDSEVIIVGGGPVGDALAIELGLHNVKTLVLEHYHMPLHLPKAMGLSARSVEFFRRWGMRDMLQDAVLMPSDHSRSLVWCSGLTGKLFAHVDYAHKEYFSAFSPEFLARLPLYRTEGALRTRLAELSSVRLVCDTKVVGVTEGKKGVTVHAEDLFEKRNVTFSAPYVIGCDGADSLVRSAIHSTLTEHEIYSTNLKIHFYSPDLDEKVTLPQAVLYSIYGAARGTFGPIDAKGHWYAQIKCSSEEEAKSMNIVEELQKLAGVRFTCEIENYAIWTMQKAIASSFGTKRIFLAGDAAHIFPPTGGHGLNTGLGDTVNLGWKLAAVIQGWGDEKLLATYKVERQPIARRNVNASGKNAAMQKIVVKEHPPEKDPEGFQEALAQLAHIHGEGVGIDHGYRYENSPIIVKDGTKEPEDDFSVYKQVARPGHYAPHVWLEGQKPLYDLFGLGFTLLVTEGDVSVWEESAHKRNVPLTVVRVQNPNVSHVYKKFSLIRPDWHLAWHGDVSPSNVDEIWDVVTGCQKTVVAE